MCVCRSASAALRSPSISGTALHPTNAPRETLVGKGMILRPPREAIAVSTPNPGRRLAKAMGSSKTDCLAMRSSIVRRDVGGGLARPGSLHGEVEEIPTPCLPSPAHSFPHLLRSGEQESGLWSPTVRPMSRGTSLASRRQPAPRHAERGGTSCSIHAACMQHPCNIHAASMQHPCNGTCGHGGGYREYRARPPKSTFHSAVRCEGRACSGAGWGRAGSRAASCWVEWGVLRHIQ